MSSGASRIVQHVITALSLTFVLCLLYKENILVVFMLFKFLKAIQSLSVSFRISFLCFLSKGEIFTRVTYPAAAYVTPAPAIAGTAYLAADRGTPAARGCDVTSWYLSAAAYVANNAGSMAAYCILKTKNIHYDSNRYKLSNLFYLII